MTIVLVIILAFLAMSVPFFANFSPQMGLNTASREVSTLLRTTRSYAITKFRRFDAVFDMTTVPNRFWIYDPLPPEPEVKGMVGKGLSLPSGVIFEAPVTISFVSSGGLTATSATSVTITNSKGKTKTIAVNSVTGAVEIQ